jgi:hypothetical protein
MGSVLSSNSTVLVKQDLGGIADKLKTCKNVIVMSGAGKSRDNGPPVKDD